MDIQPQRSVLASLPRLVLALAQTIGLDAARLAHVANLSPLALENPEGRVPLGHYAELWKALAEGPEAAGILPHTKSIADLSVIGVVGYVMANSPTVGAACSAYARHRRILGDFLEFKPEVVPEGFCLSFLIPPPFAHLPLFAEAVVAVHHALLRVLCGGDLRPTAVFFPHAPERAAPGLAWYSEECVKRASLACTDFDA